MEENHMKIVVVLGAMTLLIMGTSLTLGQDELKWEELVAKHLESIGTEQARSSVKTRIMNGVARVFFILGNKGKTSGEGRVVSSERMMCIAMNFGRHDYPGEHLAFDGEEVTVGLVEPGQRSNLSQFVYEHQFLIKEGLMGGVTSTSWCLYDVEGRRPNLKYKGLKKIEGTELHELEYRARKGAGSFRVNLYFQPDTFRHVISKYFLRVPTMILSKWGGVLAFERYKDYTITEEYGNFKEVDGLTLPHSYKLRYTFEGQGRTFLTEYIIEAAETVHNIPMDRQTFRVH